MILYWKPQLLSADLESLHLQIQFCSYHSLHNHGVEPAPELAPDLTLDADLDESERAMQGD